MLAVASNLRQSTFGFLSQLLREFSAINEPLAHHASDLGFHDAQAFDLSKNARPHLARSLFLRPQFAGERVDAMPCPLRYRESIVEEGGVHALTENRSEE